MDVFQESSLADSVIFKSLNNQSELINLINSAIKSGTTITNQHIEEQLIQIQRTRISPFSDDVIQAYENGEIILIYSKNIKVPQAIPFTVFKTNGKMRAFIFVNNYGALVNNTKTGGNVYLNISMKDLYVLMEGAYTALHYYTNPTYIIRNMGLMKVCNSVYTSMFLRILNKEYALSMDSTLFNQVSFCISKFFLSKIWENKNEDVNTALAINNVLGANKADLMLINGQYNSANISNIEDLINFLKQLSSRLGSISMRYFTQCWLNMYKPGALFSMEILPYFLYVLESALIGSFIINQPMISDVIKNTHGINTFYPELSKIL